MVEAQQAVVEPQTVYAVDLEAAGGQKAMYVFANNPIGRQFATNLAVMLMREPGTKVITRGIRPAVTIKDRAEQDGFTLIDCH